MYASILSQAEMEGGPSPKKIYVKCSCLGQTSVINRFRFYRFYCITFCNLIATVNSTILSFTPFFNKGHSDGFYFEYFLRRRK